MTLHSRRRFLRDSLALAGLGLLAGCGIAPGAGHRTAKVLRIGFLSDLPAVPTSLEAFRQGLRDLGYVEGETILVEYRDAGGEPGRLPELAAELVGLDVDLILVAGAASAQAAKDATGAIPIVIAVSNDPVALGLVDSLAHPGGNVTGLSLTAPALEGKRLELLKEALPSVSRVAALLHTGQPGVERGWDRTQAAAQSLSLQLRRHDVRGAEEFDDAFSEMAGWGAQAITVLPAAAFSGNRQRLVDLAARHRLPAMWEHRGFTDAGGLMSYGPNPAELYYRSATYVDKILKGAKPADLPVEQPAKFDFIINLKTAQALGLTIPQSVLLQATEVIQ